MGLYERNQVQEIVIELENKPNLEDFINILFQNGYWVRVDFKNGTSSPNNVLVWISEERG